MKIIFFFAKIRKFKLTELKLYSIAHVISDVSLYKYYLYVHI